VDRWSEAGQLLSFALPRDEQQRQQRLLAFAGRGIRYVYTVNGQVILQLHRTPTHRDLLRHAGHAASTLYCDTLWYHLERLRDADQWRPTTLAVHNQTIRQLADHPEQRERIGQHWRVCLLCDECERAGRLICAARDPVETDTGAKVACVCGHGGDQHRVGPIVLWRLAPHGGPCTTPGCACTELRPQTSP